jgi:hypothetical protein
VEVQALFAFIYINAEKIVVRPFEIGIASDAFTEQILGRWLVSIFVGPIAVDIHLECFACNLVAGQLCVAVAARVTATVAATEGAMIKRSCFLL